MRPLAGFASGCLLAFVVSAQAPDPRADDRMKSLAAELRCLVCQNQTIADSNAPLAVDLREQIRTQVQAGRSDQQIRDYMVERYGDFVLYRPPMKATTALLWLGPLLFILVGVAVFARIVRRRRATQQPATPLPPGEREALREMLEKD